MHRIVGLLLLGAGLAWAGANAPVRVGLDVLQADPSILAGARVGVVTNATALDAEFRHALDVIHALPDVTLVAAFAPEHGVRGVAQAGERVDRETDRVTGVVVHSLYGDVKRPTRAMLDGVDVLAYDVQDVGSRFYTYISTLREVLVAAADAGIRVVILDRPNPLGGLALDGPLLEPAFRSFVGADALPVRHGMTVGEIARFMNRDVGARLDVVPMQGWRRAMLWRDTGLTTWVLPSPNMPTPDTALVYPGMGLLEGTNLSEGRGTTRPFELFGAPWLEPIAFASALEARGLPGVRFRPTAFRPTFSKHEGATVGGVQLHVTDPHAFRAFRTALEVLAVARSLHPDAFRIDRGAHFDALAGNGWVRAALDGGVPPAEIEARYVRELERFEAQRREFLLYE